MFRHATVAFFLFAASLEAQTVKVNSHIVTQLLAANVIDFAVSQNGHPPPFQTITCFECYTEVAFRYENNKIRTWSILVDEGSDWFLVHPGDVFSETTVGAGQFPTIVNFNSPPAGGEVEVGSGDFYLGLRTSSRYGDIQNRDVYGWVHLRPVNGSLTMVENVVSYMSRGIIVGTTSVVPEPATMISCGWGLALFVAFLRCSRSARLVNQDVPLASVVAVVAGGENCLHDVNEKIIGEC